MLKLTGDLLYGRFASKLFRSPAAWHAEALALQQWLVSNSALLETFPLSNLGDRLLSAF
jgi:hypothetical protein